LTYAQAAELTWPQLMHAMGIDANAREDDSAVRLAMAQDAIFEKIAECRRCLPVELLRIPAGDLVELVKGSGSVPVVGLLLASLRRYVEDRMGR
jgi:hypothetical protein